MSTSETPAASAPLSRISVPPSLTSRIIYFLQVWGLKLASIIAFKIIRLFKPIPPQLLPSILKAYPCRPELVNRIFIPTAHKAGGLLPLYLDLHGGGHVLLDAQFDDEFCATLANRLNVLVVSIEYRKAPLHKFPGPTGDVVAIAQAIIEDTSLPVDKSRVVLGGFSAGGNLCLSAAQMPELRGKLRGLVSCYPITDFTLTPEQKHASRLYRNPKDVDDLKDWGPIWEWAYIRPGQDLYSPRLSVRYVKSEDLPSWIYMVGAEYDMLANEARETIYSLASLDKQEKEAAFYGFEKNGYKWTLARDVRHGFTHDLMDNPTAEAVAMNEKRKEELLEALGIWLFKGPFAV